MSALDTPDTGRLPDSAVVVHGSDRLAASIVAVRIARGRGIESRLVDGAWEHRAYGRLYSNEGAS